MCREYILHILIHSAFSYCISLCLHISLHLNTSSCPHISLRPHTSLCLHTSSVSSYILILSQGSLITPGHYWYNSVLSKYLIYSNKVMLEMIYKGKVKIDRLGKVWDGQRGTYSNTWAVTLADTRDTEKRTKKVRELWCGAWDAGIEKALVTEQWVNASELRAYFRLAGTRSMSF